MGMYKFSLFMNTFLYIELWVRKKIYFIVYLCFELTLLEMKGISLLEKRRTGNLDSRIHLTKRILVVYEISGSHIITPPLSSYLKTPVFAVISLKKVAEDIREPGVNRCNFADVPKLERETRRKVLMTFWRGRSREC